MPESLPDRTAHALALVDAGRRIPLALAVLLADTRARWFPKRRQAQDFAGWLSTFLGRSINPSTLAQALRTGELLIDAEVAADTGDTADAKVWHATLCRLDSTKLYKISQIPRPGKLAEFLAKYPAETLIAATREELRDLVDEFLGATPVSSRTAGARVPAHLEVSDLLEQLGAADPVRVSEAAATLRPDALVHLVQHSVLLTERQAETGRLSTADLHAAMSAMLDGIKRLIPLAKAAGIELS